MQIKSFLAFFLIFMIAGITAVSAASPTADTIQSAINDLTTKVNDLISKVAQLFTKTDDLQTQINSISPPTVNNNIHLNQTPVNVVVNTEIPKTKKYSIFVKATNIDGESKDANHADWIDALSVEHGMNVPGLAPGKAVTENIEHDRFKIVKVLDKSSPKLYDSLSQGRHINNVIIELVNSEGTRYMKYELLDVFVSSVKTAGNSYESDLKPTEEVSFSYGKIKWTYTEIDESGNPAGNVEAEYDLSPVR